MTSAAWTVPSRAFSPSSEAARAAGRAGQRIGEMRGQQARRFFQPRAGDRHRDAVQEQLPRRGQQSRRQRLAAAGDDPLADPRRQAGVRSLMPPPIR